MRTIEFFGLHPGRYRQTSVIQYFFYFAPILNFKLKESSKHNAKKINLADRKGW
jgi:hypothetical protein